MSNIFKLKFKYFIFLILIIISVFSVHLTNSRYTSGKKGNGDLAIAKPIVEFENVSETNISNMMPGQRAEYYFNIKNIDSESSVNEVLINYYIQVSVADSNLPITYTIYDVTNEITPLETTSNKTSLITLGYKEIETHKYKIEFVWAESENSETYANKQTTFNIEVYAEQVVN